MKWLLDCLFEPINRKLDKIMADLSALQAAATQISMDVQGAITALDDLAAKVGAGSATQADVDAITATLSSASDNLDAAVATDDPPTPA